MSKDNIRQKIVVEGEDKYFDVAAPDLFLTEHGKYMDAIDRLHTSKYFNRKQSKEFYLGMIAAFRSATSILKSLDNINDVEDLLTDCSIMATLIAKTKIKLP